MKKVFVLLLAICFIVSLIGCSSPSGIVIEEFEDALDLNFEVEAKGRDLAFSANSSTESVTGLADKDGNVKSLTFSISNLETELLDMINRF